MSNLCIICIENNSVFYKLEPCKQIIMSRLKERYIMDITYIPIELIENNNFKYKINVIYHFYRYLFSFPLDNKNAESIESKLKYVLKKWIS